MSVDRRTLLTGALAASVVSLRRLPDLAHAAAEAAPLVLTAAPGTLRLAGNTETAVWTYNGQVPGPVLRIRLGQTLNVRLVNRLPQPTTLCWHGVRLPNAMDGVAGLTQPAVPAGGSFDYRFAPPDSGTFWYHPHAWPHSAEQIERGLHGLLIVDEPSPPPVDDDLLVVLEDWSLDGQGAIEAEAGPACGVGVVGPLLTVNGKPLPERRVAAPGSRIRVRLLNACGTRIALAGVAGIVPTVVAVDGQPSGAFEPAGGIVPIGPGARFDFMFDLPGEPASPVSLVLRGDDGKQRPFLLFETGGKPRLPPRTAAKKLPDNPLLPTRIALERSVKIDVPLAVASQPTNHPDARIKGDRHADTPHGAPLWCWTLGGRPSDGATAEPLFSVAQGGAVTLAVKNQTDVAQQIHLHGHVFRVLHDLDDGWDPFWRDSVLVGPHRTKHIAFIADNPGRWLIESSLLAPQIAGMARYFTVVPVRARRR